MVKHIFRAQCIRTLRTLKPFMAITSLNQIFQFFRSCFLMTWFIDEEDHILNQACQDIPHMVLARRSFFSQHELIALHPFSTFSLQEKWEFMVPSENGWANIVTRFIPRLRGPYYFKVMVWTIMKVCCSGFNFLLIFWMKLASLLSVHPHFTLIFCQITPSSLQCSP